MSIKNLFILTLFIISFVSVNSALAKEDSTLVYLYERALKYDAEYLQALSEHAASRETTHQAWSRFLPQVSIGASHTHTLRETLRSESLFYRLGLDSFRSKSRNISMSQSIFKVEDIHQLSLAKLEKKRADVALLISKSELISRLLDRYFGTLGAEDAVSLAEKEVAAIKGQLENEKARFQSQLGRKAEYLDVLSQYSLAESNLLLAFNQRDDAIEFLEETSGFVPAKFKGLNELNIEVEHIFDEKHWEQLALEFNLDLQQERINVEIAKKEVQKEGSTSLPKVEFVASRSVSDEAETDIGGGRKLDTEIAEIRFEMPLFQGGYAVSRVRELKRLHQAARDKLLATKRRVLRDTRVAHREMASSINRIEALEQAVSAQALVVTTLRAGFPRLYTSVEVVEAERDYFSAFRDLTEARYDYVLSMIKLKRTAGSLSDEDIKVVDTWLN